VCLKWKTDRWNWEYKSHIFAKTKVNFQKTNFANSPFLHFSSSILCKNLVHFVITFPTVCPDDPSRIDFHLHKYLTSKWYIFTMLSDQTCRALFFLTNSLYKNVISWVHRLTEIYMKNLTSNSSPNRPIWSNEQRTFDLILHNCYN